MIIQACIPICSLRDGSARPMTNTATPPSTPASTVTKLPLYNLFATIPGPRNFAVKIFLFSFVGTQLPMFALLVYMLMNVELNAEILTTVSIVLITALLGSASTVKAVLMKSAN